MESYKSRGSPWKLEAPQMIQAANNKLRDFTRILTQQIFTFLLLFFCLFTARRRLNNSQLGESPKSSI